MKKQLIAILCLILWSDLLTAQYINRDFNSPFKDTPTTDEHLVLANGKLMLSGDYSFFGNKRVNFLVRLNEDGSLDETFNVDSFLKRGFISSLTEGINGDIAFIHQDGSLDQERVFILNDQGEIKSEVIAESDEGILRPLYLASSDSGYVGVFERGFPNRFIYKFDSSGDLDPSFTPVSIPGDITDLLVDSEDNYYMLGEVEFNGMTYNVLKVDSNGMLDENFDAPVLPNSRLSGEILADDSFLLWGTITEINGEEVPSTLYKFQPNGQLDEDFDASVLLNIFGGGFVQQLAVAQSGEILVFGSEGGLNGRSIYSLNSDGTFNTAFNQIGPLDIFGFGVKISQWGDEMILTSISQIGLGRNRFPYLNFSITGDVVFEKSSRSELFRSGTIYSIAPTVSGHYLIGGSFVRVGNTDINHLVKINAEGEIDDTFLNQQFIAETDAVRKIVSVDSVDFYLSGNFIDDDSFQKIIKVDQNGNRNSEFAFTESVNGFLRDIVLYQNNIIITGPFTFSFDQQIFSKIVMLDSSGKPITSFQVREDSLNANQINNVTIVDESVIALSGRNLTNFNDDNDGFIWFVNDQGDFVSQPTKNDGLPLNSASTLIIDETLFLAGTQSRSSSGRTNPVLKFDLSSSETDAVTIATKGTDFPRGIYALEQLSDSTILICGQYDELNNAVAHDFGVVNIATGRVQDRLQFQVDGENEDAYLLSALKFSDTTILIGGIFNEIDGFPVSGLAIVNLNNFQTQVEFEERLTVNEDSSVLLTDFVNVTDLDDTWNIDFVPSDNFEVINDSVLVFTPNFFGTEEVTYQVLASDFTSDELTTTIEVLSVNDPPEISGQLSIPDIANDETYRVELTLLDFFDVDDTDFILVLDTGSNYSLVDEHTILPESGFVGNISVNVRVSDGESESNNFALILNVTDPVLSLEVPNLKFYPNPVRDYLYLENAVGLHHFKIMDISGKIYHDQKWMPRAENLGINVRDLPRGVYILHMKVADDWLQRKFVKL